MNILEVLHQAGDQPKTEPLTYVDVLPALVGCQYLNVLDVVVPDPQPEQPHKPLAIEAQGAKFKAKRMNYYFTNEQGFVNCVEEAKPEYVASQFRQK